MRRLFGLFVTLLLLSCNQENANMYQLTGLATGFENGTKIFVSEIGTNNQPKIVDTLEIVNGTFKASFIKEDKVALKILRVEGTKNNILYFNENEPLRATIYKDSLFASRVLGGKQNELYAEYNDKIAAINRQKQAVGIAFQQAQLEQDGIMVNELRAKNNILQKEEKNFKRQFVTQNPNSVFGVMLLSELFSKEDMTAAETTQVIANLSPKMANHPEVSKLKTTLAAKKKASIGGAAPTFSAPTPTGEILSLDEVLGKYTIIDFWASWCRPCRMENPNVVKVYNKYHDKGLNIISVSLDKANQKERWIKAIADDQMDWYHVSNLKFWNDPIARQYNVRSIPATFLLDEKGNIIDKNLRGKALGDKIASLLD